MNVSGIICAELNSAEGIFVSFPSWLKHVKSGSKIAPFFNWALFLDLISKKKTIAFFRRKLSKLHTQKKQNTILHVTFTFSLKQKTRTSSGSIWVPLTDQRVRLVGKMLQDYLILVTGYWIIVKLLTICTCSYNQRVPKQNKTRNNNGRHDHITSVGDHYKCNSE